MTTPAALPFQISRSHDVIGGTEITTTRETVHGLLRLEAERLVVQWRLARATERVGMEIRTDREVEPVREVVVPLDAIASARVKSGWQSWLSGPQLVITAADLRAFEELMGMDGLRMDHPATLTVRIRRPDQFAAREFAGELELAVADRALRAAERPAALPPPDEQT